MAVSLLRLYFTDPALVFFERGEILKDRLDPDLLPLTGVDEEETMAACAFLRGLIAEQEGDSEDADHWFEVAFNMNKALKDSLVRAAAALHEALYRHDRARSVFAILLAADPAEVPMQLNTAEVAMVSERFSEVRELTARALDDPEPTHALMARFLRLLASLRAGDEPLIESDRADLEHFVAVLPADAQVNWTFLGTKHAIENGILAGTAREWAMRLIGAASPFDRAALLAAVSKPG
jgi:tetratricopeptide (TPR) repeat protein